METRNMRRIASASGLILGLALAGCGPVNRGIESVNQPVVSRTDYVIDVATDSAGLAPGEGHRLGSWFDTLRLGYGDRISIDDPSPFVHAESRHDVAVIAGRYGLLLSAGTPITMGSPAAGQMRVIVSRSVASTPHCPNWDLVSQPDFAASTTSNYGCAVNTNTALMVANATDLVRGQTDDGAGDPLATSKAISVYRESAPTGKGGLPGGVTSVSVTGGGK